MKTTTDSVHTPKELLHDLQSLVSEAEAMMASSITENTGEAIETLRARFHAAKVRLTALGENARDKVVAGAKCTDESIRANPYQSIAIAAGVGLLIGVLFGRRSH